MANRAAQGSTPTRLDGHPVVVFSRRLLDRREEALDVEDAKAQTIFTTTSLLCMVLLSFMFGVRAKHLHFRNILRTNFTRLLVIALYGMAICFVLSSAIIETGLGLPTHATCQAAILICLVFYVGSKIVMYVFLVERAHALRAPYVQRFRDWVWMASMLIVTMGFGAIAVASFISPTAELSQTDGQCRIGLPLKVTIPLLTYDIAINIGLTALFIHFLAPSLRFGFDEGRKVPFWVRFATSCVSKRAEEQQGEARQESWFGGRHSNQEMVRAIRWLAWKSVIGATLVMMPTIANLALLVSLEGSELRWLCLTICTLDITWGTCVVHWLTADPMEVDANIRGRTEASGPLGRDNSNSIDCPA